jgi:hypothetical protein
MKPSINVSIAFLLSVSPLLAQKAKELPEPGKNKTLLAQIMVEDGAAAWRLYKGPSPQAVVEVLGTLSEQELREATFKEFLTWFYKDLHAFWERYGYVQKASPAISPERYGGNPTPKLVPIGQPVKF